MLKLLTKCVIVCAITICVAVSLLSWLCSIPVISTAIAGVAGNVVTLVMFVSVTFSCTVAATYLLLRIV